MYFLFTIFTLLLYLNQICPQGDALKRRSLSASIDLILQIEKYFSEKERIY